MHIDNSGNVSRFWAEMLMCKTIQEVKLKEKKFFADPSNPDANSLVPVKLAPLWVSKIDNELILELFHTYQETGSYSAVCKHFFSQATQDFLDENPSCARSKANPRKFFKFVKQNQYFSFLEKNYEAFGTIFYLKNSEITLELALKQCFEILENSDDPSVKARAIETMLKIYKFDLAKKKQEADIAGAGGIRFAVNISSSQDDEDSE